MKTEGFVKLLRKIIREEVSKAVRTELKPLLNEVNNVSPALSEIAPRPVVKKQQKQYTKNTILNDLLNETASAPASQELADWSSVNFKKDMDQSFSANRQPSMPLATSGINGEAVNMSNPKVASTMKAMTRDYSGLIKAIDKKNGKMGIRR
jgi:hypothetical protein|tara:strand:+ start:1708 stop:2160 length:453 start_codon:yes stop_codon:yes gene_type:complete